MVKVTHKISNERMAELVKLSKLLPGLQMLDNAGKPMFNLGFKDIKYADLSPADKKKYTDKRQGPFKRIEKTPRYINHLTELVRIYKKDGAAGVESYAQWCNQITARSNAAAAKVRPKNFNQDQTIAKIDTMIEAANGAV